MVSDKIKKINALEKHCEQGKAFMNLIKNTPRSSKMPRLNKNLTDNQFIMLSSIYESISKNRPKKVIFYDLVARIVPNSKMVNFYENGYCDDFGIELHYADLLIESLIASKYHIDYSCLLKFDVEDYKIYMENISLISLKRSNKWDEYKLQKYVEVKPYVNKVCGDVEVPEEIMNNYREENIRREDRNELIVKKALDDFCINYEYQKILSVNNKIYIADFYLNDYGIIIECDGGIHYKDDEHLVKDRKRDASFAKVGILTVRFDNFDNLLELEVRKFIYDIVLNKKIAPKL